MAKEKLLEAKRLIQNKEYAAAKSLLATIDHPKAREWEARLNMVAENPPLARSGKSSGGRSGRRGILLAIGSLLVIIIVVVIALVMSGGSDDDPGTQVVSDNTPTAAVTEESSASSDRPASIPADFPFPADTFTPVLDNSQGDEVFVSVSTPQDFAALEAFYRAQLPAAGYQIITDTAVGTGTVLSFVGDDLQGSVRLTQDGIQAGESRITISLEPRDPTVLTPGAPSGQSAVGETRFDDAIEAARAFINAAFSGDETTAAGLLCEAMRGDAGEAMIRGIVPPIPLAQIDTSLLEYTLLNQDSGRAQVTVSGQLRMTIQNNVVTQDAADMLFELIDEDGWKICVTS